MPRRILPERVFGRPRDHQRRLEAGHRADAVAHELHGFVLDLVRRPLDPGLEHQEAERHLALQRIGDADHRAFGDIGMRRQHLLDLAGREPVGGDVDDVVGAGHHVDVAVGVDEPGVGGLIETRERRCR